MSESLHQIRGLTSAQMQAIQEALEFYARMGMNQIQHLMEKVRFGDIPTQMGLGLPPQKLSLGDELIDQFKRVLFGTSAGANKGIPGETTPQSAKIAWDLYRVVRHRLAWDRNPHGDVSVDFDDPYAQKVSEEPKVTALREGALGGEDAYALGGLSMTQMRVLSNALHVMAKLGTGRPEIVLDLVMDESITNQDGSSIRPERVEAAMRIMREFKREMTGFEMGGSFGIHHPAVPATARAAYEARKAVIYAQNLLECPTSYARPAQQAGESSARPRP